jgi:hypothetical protein
VNLGRNGRELCERLRRDEERVERARKSNKPGVTPNPKNCTAPRKDMYVVRSVVSVT